MTGVALALASALALSVGPQEVPSEDRIYGRVLTAAGAVHEGWLRWDRNEGSWGDLLDGSKELPWQNFRDAERLDPVYRRARERERSIEIAGLRISWDEDDDERPVSSTSGVRFGHLRSLRPLGRDRVLLTLRSGEEVVLAGGSTDIGSGFRGLEVETAGGTTELRWRDIDEIELMSAPRGTAPPTSARLHGTVTTVDGLTFTGHVAWDTDEAFGSDVLDGEGETGRDHEIEFEHIAAIEPLGSRAARVVLVDGEELTLRGTNDVNSSNRGIGVSDPGLGQVIVPWQRLEAVRFHAPERSTTAYDDFERTGALFGTVATIGGERFRGRIRWDNDEESGWELLNGNDAGLEYDVELALVDRVARRGSWGVEVTLLDGRVLELEGSNDVDEQNKGIFVTLESGEMVLVQWGDFEELALER